MNKQELLAFLQGKINGVRHCIDNVNSDILRGDSLTLKKNQGRREALEEWYRDLTHILLNVEELEDQP